MTDKAAGTRDRSVRTCGCKRRRKDRKQRNKQIKKSRGPQPSLPSLTWARGGDVAGCRDHVVKHREEGQMSPSAPTRPAQTPAPVPADDPKCPPSAPTIRITSNVQIVRIRKTDPAFLRCRFGIPTHLCKRTEKEIDGLCCCELTGYVRVTVGVIMLLFTF